MGVSRATDTWESPGSRDIEVSRMTEAYESPQQQVESLGQMRHGSPRIFWHGRFPGHRRTEDAIKENMQEIVVLLPIIIIYVYVTFNC